MGASVARIDDVGVASLTRVTDRLSDLREQDVLIVVAGREGALPTVVAATATGVTARRHSLGYCSPVPPSRLSTSTPDSPPGFRLD
jgi:NCAIR mutase (PurE)-related protein